MNLKFSMQKTGFIFSTVVLRTVMMSVISFENAWGADIIWVGGGLLPSIYKRRSTVPGCRPKYTWPKQRASNSSRRSRWYTRNQGKTWAPRRERILGIPPKSRWNTLLDREKTKDPTDFHRERGRLIVFWKAPTSCCHCYYNGSLFTGLDSMAG
jgi:hypothetical protein